MLRVINAIEDKLAAQETDIYLLKMENERLKGMVRERDERIAELEKRGESNVDG